MKKIFAVFIFAILFFLVQAHSGYSLEKDSPTGTRKTQQELDIMLVLDNSGSMIKNDPNFLTRDVVMNFLRGFGDKSRIGMVIFDQEAKLVEPLIEITIPGARAEFIESLDTVNYKGQFSDSPAGIERAIYELKLHGRMHARKVIFFKFFHSNAI